MKITKTFISIFLVTFLIGFVLVPTPKKETIISFEEATAILQKMSPPIETLIINLPIEDKVEWFENDESKFKIKLLETGEDFNDEDVIAKNGETWLGLFKENNYYFLRPTKLKISRTRDDANHNYRMKKSIEVSNKTKPIFLLKNFTPPKENKITTTLFQGMTWSDILEYKEQPDFNSYEMLTKLNKDFNENYKISGREFTLKVIEAKNQHNVEILALILESDGTRQILHTMSKKESSDLGNLYWVGDLDSDGKPDFYLDLHENDNILERTLFLSSKAENGKLIKAVASFVTYSNC